MSTIARFGLALFLIAAVFLAAAALKHAGLLVLGGPAYGQDGPWSAASDCISVPPEDDPALLSEAEALAVDALLDSFLGGGPRAAQLDPSPISANPGRRSGL